MLPILRLSDIQYGNIDFSYNIAFDEESSVLTVTRTIIDFGEELGSSLIYDLILTYVKHKHIDVIFKGCIFSGSGTLIFPDVHNIDFIDNCRVSDSDTTFVFLCKSLSIKSSDFQKASLKINCSKILISGSKTGQVRLERYTEGQKVGQLKTDALEVNDGSEIQNIVNLSEVLRSENSIVIVWSSNSRILINEYTNYRILKLLATKNNDVIQSHSLYIKILNSTSFQKEDRVLRFLAFISNNHGLSFLRPILLMLLVNTIAFSIFWHTLVWEWKVYSDFFVILNINPLDTSLSKDFQFNDWKNSIDGLRRLLLGVLTYQTIVAARRFSFSKK